MGCVRPNSPVEHQQEDECRQVLRRNIRLLLEAEEDDNDDETWDDIITLEENKTEEDRHLVHDPLIEKYTLYQTEELHHPLFRGRTRTNRTIWKMVMVVSV